MVLIYKLEFKQRKKNSVYVGFRTTWGLKLLLGAFFNMGVLLDLLSPLLIWVQEEAYEAIKFLCYMYFSP